jgi:hypothetical protein
VALRQGRAALPGSELCDSVVAFVPHEPSRVGEELGGNVLRAAVDRHGDSGFNGARDGAARRRYVPHVGLIGEVGGRSWARAWAGRGPMWACSSGLRVPIFRLR